MSVLDVGGGTVEVLATGGDAHLEDDLDRALAVWLAKEAKSLNAEVDPRGALMAARRETARRRWRWRSRCRAGRSRHSRGRSWRGCAPGFSGPCAPAEIAADSAGINLKALRAAARAGDQEQADAREGGG